MILPVLRGHPKTASTCLTNIDYCQLNFCNPSTVQFKMEEITRKLRTGDLGIPANPEERYEFIYHNIVWSGVFCPTSSSFLVNQLDC